MVEVISAIEQRGAPVAANKTLKSIKTFLRWCVGRAVLDQSPAEGVPLPSKEVARDRVLDDQELAQVILAARKIGGPYGGIVELLALTGQRREEVAGLTWQELDLVQRVWTHPQIADEECQGAPRAPFRTVTGCAETQQTGGAVRLLIAGNQAVSRLHACQAAVGSVLRSDRMAAS